MNICQLDTLPVELVHHLLGYFSAHEIFSTFTNVTSYIDAVLAAYTNYRVNFKAITRPNFDLVCQQMRPDQVIALTLSNGEDTPGLVGLFLSRFQINQCTRLQSLRLIEIGADFWESIIIPMAKLKYLRSFCFIPSNRNEQWVCDVPADFVTHLDKVLSDSYAPILPQLYQLRLYHGDFLQSIQFPHLRRLVLERSTNDLMKHISCAAPQLRSLETSFSLDASPIELIYPMTQLNCLILRIQGFQVSMTVFERMISNFPRLKHLKLIASCDDDVINGHRWQGKVENLVTFKFMFYVSIGLQSQQLESFATSFWVEQKRWFIAYTDGRFSSVPHFITTEADDDFRLPLYTTVPDKGIFYRYIDTLQLTEESISTNVYYPHVRTLGLFSVLPISSIEKVVDLHQIQHLVLLLFGMNLALKSLINAMPNLYQISMKDNMENFLQQCRSETLEKIRTLQISNILTHVNDYNIELLSAVFPNVRHLHINHKCSTVQILDFLSRFKHLSTASFHCTSWYDDKDTQQSRLNIQATLYHQMRHVRRLDFTYRFDASRIHIWI